MQDAIRSQAARRKVDCLGHGERLRDERRGTPSQTYSRAEARPATFWTQKEAQVCADTLNDLDLQGFIPDLF